MTNKIMELADAYAHCCAFVGCESMPIARAALQAEVEKLAAENADHIQQLRKEQLTVQQLCAEIAAAKTDAARYRNFIDAMCQEVFDTWTTGYKMQQIALNIRDADTRRAAMKGQP